MALTVGLGGFAGLALGSLLAMVGVDPSAVAASAGDAKLLEKISRIRSESEMPGLSIRVYQSGKKVFALDDGIRALGHTRKVGALDRWHIGSCTKSMTAVLIGQLVQEGKLSWETPLSALFKGARLSPGIAGATVEMLLSHRSGAMDVTRVAEGKLWPRLFDQFPDVASARTALVSAILENEPAFVPDSRTEYSNSGFVLLGAVVEKLRGKGWEEVLRERIFRPLGMKSCGFGPSDARGATEPGQPWGHAIEKNGLASVPPSAQADNPAALGPAGTVHCSSDDFAKYLSVLDAAYARDARLISREVAAKLFSVSKKPPYTFASMGRTEKAWASGPVLTMAGSNTLNYTRVAIAPHRHRIFLISTNSGSEKAEGGVERILELLTELK